jgi:hypothetical protein
VQFFGANAFVERLTFAELEFTASTGLTGFLTLNLACVTSEETVLLQGRTILSIDLAECASDTHTGCFCLAVNATTIEVDVDVIALHLVENQHGLFHNELENVQGEVNLKGLLVDGNGTVTGLNVNASNS